MVELHMRDDIRNENSGSSHNMRIRDRTGPILPEANVLMVTGS